MAIDSHETSSAVKEEEEGLGEVGERERERERERRAGTGGRKGGAGGRGGGGGFGDTADDSLIAGRERKRDGRESVVSDGASLLSSPYTRSE